MKIRKRRTVIRRYFILLVLAMVFMIPATVYASSESAAVQIPVKQIFTVKQGTVPKGGDIFYYTLTPQQADAPMPKGSKDGAYSFSLKATQEGTLPEITYTKVGDYEYQIQQAAVEDKDGYGYDGKTYTVVVSVRNRDEGGLYADLIVKNGAGEKVETAAFENTYTGKKEAGTTLTPPSYTTPASQGRPLVKTGDETNLPLLLAMIAVSSLILIVAIGAKRKKKENA